MNTTIACCEHDSITLAPASRYLATPWDYGTPPPLRQHDSCHVVPEWFNPIGVHLIFFTSRILIEAKNGYAAGCTVGRHLVGDSHYLAVIGQPVLTPIYLSAKAEVALMTELTTHSQPDNLLCIFLLDRGYR